MTKKGFLTLTIAVVIAGCNDAATQQEKPTGSLSEARPLTADEPQQEPLPMFDHQDGMAYGYTLAPSQAGAEAGNAGQNIVMIYYAGQRDDVHQLHQISGTAINAIQCKHPCEVMKVISAVEGLGVVNTQHYRIEANAVAAMAVADAHNGFLRQYGIGEGKNRYTVWVDEQRGILRTRLK